MVLEFIDRPLSCAKVAAGLVAVVQVPLQKTQFFELT